MNWWHVRRVPWYARRSLSDTASCRLACAPRVGHCPSLAGAAGPTIDRAWRASLVVAVSSFAETFEPPNSESQLSQLHCQKLNLARRAHSTRLALAKPLWLNRGREALMRQESLMYATPDPPSVSPHKTHKRAIYLGALFIHSLRYCSICWRRPRRSTVPQHALSCSIRPTSAGRSALAVCRLRERLREREQQRQASDRCCSSPTPTSPVILV